MSKSERTHNVIDPQVKRINIVGTSGSGKSYFGRSLANKISAKFIGVDELFWLPNWQARGDEDFFNLLENELDCESWVLDGNYHKTEFIKWKNVDAIIWIDLPFWRNFQQVFIRSLKRCISKKEIWPGSGNYESFSQTFFSKHSILWWMIRSYSKNKEYFEKRFQDADLKHIKIVRLRSRGEMKQFLEEFNP